MVGIFNFFTLHIQNLHFCFYLMILKLMFVLNCLWFFYPVVFGDHVQQEVLCWFLPDIS